MATNKVRAGYMGLANIGGTRYRCTSFSVNPKHDVSFYNHVIGLKDTIPRTSAVKGENLETSYANIQRRIWRPSPISITGGMSFPATETNISPIFELARYANYFDIEFDYYCRNSTSGDNNRTFKNCRINGFDFSVNAGDIVTISLDVAATDFEGSTSSIFHYKTPEKLITWDKCPVEINNAPFSIDHTIINGLSFKINNNIQTIYVTDNTVAPVPGPPVPSHRLLPHDLRAGMQEVSGTVSIYLGQGYEYIPISLSSPSQIKFTCPSLSVTMSVVFNSCTMEGQVGPIVTQLPFVGVDYVFS